MHNYEIIYNTIVRLGGAGLDRLVVECSMSQSTVSVARHPLKKSETDHKGDRR